MEVGATQQLNDFNAPQLPAYYLEQRWYAVYTCANHEKRVAKQFDERRIEHFLPLFGSVRRWKDRRVHLQLPLFPGYIFVRVALNERLRVLEVPGVVHLVGFGKHAVPLPDAAIGALRHGISGPLTVAPHPYLRVGQLVRLRSGPFKDLEGILIRKRNGLLVVLSLDLIARSISVEVDVEDIELVSRRPLATVAKRASG